MPGGKKYLFLFLVFAGMNFSFSQNRYEDSLLLSLKTANHDTTKCAILSLVLEEESNDDKWIAYTMQMKQIAVEGMKRQGNSKAETRAFKIYYAMACHNEGFRYNELGDVRKAIECYSKCLAMRENINDKIGVAATLNNLGAIYDGLDDTAKAIEYYLKSLKIKEELNDKASIALSLNNIGFFYKNRGDFKKAEEYYNRSIELKKELGDKRGLAQSLNNLGILYKNQEEYDKAIKYYEESLKLFEEVGDKSGTASSLANLGSFYLRKKEMGKAESFAVRSMKLSLEMQYPAPIRNAARILSQIYKAKGDSKKALEYTELYITMRDSINNEQTKKAGIQSQLKYEYEKKSAADSVKNAEQQKVKDAQLSAQTASLKQEKFQRYALVVGLLLVVCGLLFVINRFRITQKQKKIIEEQKIVVDEAFEKLHEKNKEVMDSIYYARRIQRALITSEKYILKHLDRLNRKN
jgi:tetratricopeptide (TPR) repeat protein